MDESAEARHRRAWERFMDAERRELEHRRDGQLSKLLAGPVLPGETRAELDRLAEEDRGLAERGLAALMDSGGGIRYKRVEELAPGDRADRARAQAARVEWLTERTRRLQNRT